MFGTDSSRSWQTPCLGHGRGYHGARHAAAVLHCVAQWACAVGADFVAASFVRTASNVRAVIAYLDRCVADLPLCNGQIILRPLVISKIESKEGVDNCDEGHAGSNIGSRS